MNESKVQQNRLKTWRYYTLMSAFSVLLILALAATVTLNSRPFQKWLFAGYVAPSLAERELSIDFSGFDYQFPSSFFFGPTTLNYRDSALITVTNIELHDVFWSSHIGVRNILVNQCELHSPLDGERVKGFINSFNSDSDNAGQSFQATIGAISLDSIHGSSTSNDISWTISGETGNVVLDDELSAEDVSLLAVLNGVQFEVEAANISKSSEGHINFDYLLTSNGIAKASGGVSGFVDSLYFEGSIQTDTSIELASIGIEEYESILQACEFSFNGSWYNSEFTGRVSGGNSSYSMRSTLTQKESDSYRISTDFELSHELYKWPIFAGLEPILSVFRPKNVQIGIKTDFSDFSWSTVLTDKNNRWELSSESQNDPVRGMLLSNQLALGPIESAKAQMSILPNLSAVLGGDDFEILAALPEIRSNGEKIKGLNARFEHRQDNDSLWLSSLDPNFDIELYGSRKGKINKVSGIINALNLALVDSSSSGQILSTSAKAIWTDEAIGTLAFNDFVLSRPDDVVFLSELNLKHQMIQDERSFAIKGDVLDTRITGKWNLTDLYKIKNLIIDDLISEKSAFWPETKVNFHLRAGDVNWLFDLFSLDFGLGQNSFVEFQFDGTKKTWSSVIELESIFYSDLELKEVQQNSSVSNGEHYLIFTTEELNFDAIELSELSVELTGTTDDKSIKFLGIIKDTIPSNVSLNATLSNNKLNIADLNFNIGDSYFELDQNTGIVWEWPQININRMLLKGSDGEFEIASQFINSKNPELSFGAKNIKSSVLNYLLRTPNAELSGIWNSKIKLRESLTDIHAIGSLEVKDFGFNGHQYGRFNASGTYSAQEGLKAFGQLRQDKSSSFSFNMGYSPVRDELDLRASIDNFVVNPFNDLFDGVLDNFSGVIQGGLEVYGPLSDYSLNGDISMRDGQFSLPIVGAAFSASDLVDIKINNSEITIDTTQFINQSDSTTALLYGTIFHDTFDSLEFDLNLVGDSLLAVDLKRDLDGYFYGQAVISGNVLLEGPLEQLHLDLSATTLSGTDLKIPLDNPTTVELPSYIKFSDVRVPRRDNVLKQNLEYFTTDLAVKVTPDAIIELVLDEVLGDVIKARGNGNIRLKIMEDESLELYGLYTLESGDYLFTLQNIINKPFEIIPGGTILWSGDLYEAQVNIDAKYSLSTDLQGLVSNVNYQNENVNVDLIINLTGDLMNPNIAFKVDLPDAPPSYLEELQRHFLSEDAMNYQAFSLLLLGDFYQQDLAVQEGFDFGGSVSRNTSELLVSEFGSWLAAGIGSYVDLELDYTSGTNPYEILGTTQNLNLDLGKDFLDGRLSINSSLDIPIGQSGTSTLLLGDTEIIYSLTKDGRIKLRAFNRSNRNDPLMQNSGPYTQGIGILFQKEFDSVLKD